MIYKIKNTLLNVSNEIKELDDYIFGRLSQFETIQKENTKNFLKFKQNSVEIQIEENLKIFNNKIIKTDIYPIINNIVAYLINDKDNILIHAIVVSKNDKGILIVGDFGQGKSTLATEYKINGYEINSTDQTWLQAKKGKIYQKLGSRFDIKNNEIVMLKKEKTIKNIEIKKIIRPVGICDEGKVTLNENKNKYHIIKNLASSCNWTYSMPLFTDNIELFNINIYIKDFLNKIIEAKIPVIDVRGDKKKILQELGDIK